MLRLFRQYYPVRNIFFVLGEGFFIFFSVLIACSLFQGGGVADPDLPFYLRIFLITAICLTCLYYNDLYDFQVVNSFSELGIRLLQALGAAAIFLALVYYIFPEATVRSSIFVVSILLVIVFIIAWRFGYAIVLSRGFFDEKIIVLGSGDLAQNILREINEKRDCGYRATVIVLDGEVDTASLAQHSERVVTRKEGVDLCDMAESLDISKIVVALKERRGSFPSKELLKCRVTGIDIIEGNSFYEMLTGKLIVKLINPAWLIFSDGFRKSAVKTFMKRVQDLLFSVIMLVLLCPVLALTALFIKLDSKGPVFFSQDRVGKFRREYRVHKFRSMVTDAEKASGPVWAKSDDDRVTRVGRFIRKWRIDELPQLFNVLKGEMSLVGPRPEREFFVRQLEQEIPYYAERFSVKPGVTGWAQVSYGYGASVDDAVEKLNYDLFYIKNMSIFMDLMILLRTVKTVLFGVGAR